MTPLDIAAIRALAKDADAVTVYQAVERIPALCDEVERLRQSLDRCTRPDGDIWPVNAIAEIDSLKSENERLRAELAELRALPHSSALRPV